MSNPYAFSTDGVVKCLVLPGEGGARPVNRSPEIEIDRDRVRAEARKLDGVGLRVWLDRAIDLLPDEAFPALIADYVQLRDVLAEENPRPDLLDTIRQFHRDGLAGRYYEAFVVSWRNDMEKSRGTQTFIAEHSRLVEACLDAEQAGDLATAAEGLGLLIDLLREIDRFERDIVFFADEGGSWQVGVRWDRVLPAWFRSLSSAMDARGWAKTVAEALSDFAGHKMAALFEAARVAGTAAQKDALAKYEYDLLHRR